jgi:hypothetical protein
VKKFFVLAVALLVLGFAASSFAVQAEIPADTTAAIAKGGTQVTLGGELRFRGSTYQNISDFNKNVAGGTGLGAAERTIYESRIRLSVEAKMSPNTIGFIQMESAQYSSGNADQENMNWGSEGCKSLGGTFKCGDVKAGDIRIMQAWIQHSGSGLLGIPAYVKVGHQPITIGAGVFYHHNLYNDDAIVVGITPIKGLDLTALTVKMNEGLSNSADDQTLYSGIISYAFNKDIVAGVDVSYLESRPGSLYPANSDFGGTGVTSKLWNIGGNIKANVAGFKLYGTLDFQLGGDNFPNANWHYNGYALTGGAAYTFAPVTLSLDLGYGSGDRKTDNKVSTFLTSYSHGVNITWIYDYLTVNAAGNIAGGLQNTLYAKLGANADVMKDLNVQAYLSFLRAAKRSYGAGTSGSISVGPQVPVNTTSNNIGTEIDAFAYYQIDKGLKYFVEGGYLFAGNYWKSIVPAGQKVSDVWGLRHGIQLNF